MKLHHLIAATALAFAIGNPAHANYGDISQNASQNSLVGSELIVDGSVGILAAGGEFVVAGIVTAANASQVVLRKAATGSEVSVRVATKLAGNALLAVGSVVSVVSDSVGWSLISGGKLIAYLPNEIGQSLLYHSSSTQTSVR